MERQENQNGQINFKMEGGNRMYAEEILMTILDELKGIKEILQPKEMNIGEPINFRKVNSFEKPIEELLELSQPIAEQNKEVESSDELIESGAEEVNNVLEDEVISNESPAIENADVTIVPKTTNSEVGTEVIASDPSVILTDVNVVTTEVASTIAVSTVINNIDVVNSAIPNNLPTEIDETVSNDTNVDATNEVVETVVDSSVIADSAVISEVTTDAIVDATIENVSVDVADATSEVVNQDANVIVDDNEGVSESDTITTIADSTIVADQTVQA